jgi:hypothetical protein
VDSTSKTAPALTTLAFGALAPDDPARSDVERAIDEAKRAGKSAVDAMTAMNGALDADDVRGALRGTVDLAATEVEEITSASAGFLGLGGSGLKSEHTHFARNGGPLERRAQEARHARRRMRRLAMAKRRSRTKAAASELNDVTTGNDLARVLRTSC